MSSPAGTGISGATERKHWLDNLRWATVLLVLLYHVFYFYNNKGVFGGIGGFGPYPEVKQYQDAVMYILYPWFMPLLFLLAGISARYSLERKPAGRWFRDRTRKLLVPSTIGLFVFHWMTGYFNTVTASRAGVFDGMPGVARFCLWAVSGTGPLWFIQDLWLFSLILLPLRRLDAKNRFRNWCGKTFGGRQGLLWIIILAALFWLGEQTLVKNPRPESADGLINLYKPIFYLILFLEGYFIFSHEKVQKILKKAWVPLLAGAVASGIVLTVTTFGQNNTAPEYMSGPLNCIYGWLACIALAGWFQARFDCTDKKSAWLTRTSYGIYIVHYLVVVALGYQMKMYTQLPPWPMYVILAAAVFTLSPLLYEVLHRIPFIRWCVFGEK